MREILVSLRHLDEERIVFVGAPHRDVTSKRKTEYPFTHTGGERDLNHDNLLQCER